MLMRTVRFLDFRQALPDQLTEPGALRARDIVLQLLEIMRQALRELRDLLGQERDQQPKRGDDHEHGADDDDERGQRAVDPDAAHALDHRIEQIGKPHRHDERQQDVPEHPQEQREQQQRQAPEDKLALERQLALHPARRRWLLLVAHRR